jgi:Ca2+/Na+ antiporter
MVSVAIFECLVRLFLSCLFCLFVYWAKKTQHSLVNVGERGENIYVGGKNAVSFEIWLLRSSEQGGGDDCRMFVVVTPT